MVFVYARTLLLFLILALLSACSVLPTRLPEASPSPQPSPTAEAQSTPTLTPEPGPPQPVLTATPTFSELPAPLYNITASLDDAAHTVSAVEQIVYFNRSSDLLTEIPLVAGPTMYPGSFQLSGASSSAGPALKNVTTDAGVIRLELAEPLQPGQSITLEVTFGLFLPARVENSSLRPMVFGWSDRQVNLVDWYAYVPPYVDGPGWLYHSPAPYGEHQVYETADFKVQFQLLNARPGLVVAASTPGQELNGWYQYEMRGARAFVLSISPDYVVQSKQVGSTTVTTYTFPLHALAGERVLQTTAESLELYSRLFGPYPHPGLAVVEADFMDGMEFSGLFFLSNGFYNVSNGTQADYMIALAAHETAHQWWFDLVGNDQALEPWLDEALCTYSEYIYYDELHPEGLPWWWAYRVNYYEPRGPVNDTIYNPRHEVYAYRAYRDAVYLNGAIFLHELRGLVGDEAFFAFLADYAAQNREKIATSAGFFALLSEHTSADLTDIRKKYFIGQ